MRDPYSDVRVVAIAEGLKLEYATHRPSFRPEDPSKDPSACDARKPIPAIVDFKKAIFSKFIVTFLGVIHPNK
jgi:hypothetical protein